MIEYKGCIGAVDFDAETERHRFENTHNRT